MQKVYPVGNSGKRAWVVLNVFSVGNRNIADDRTFSPCRIYFFIEEPGKLIIILHLGFSVLIFVFLVVKPMIARLGRVGCFSNCKARGKPMIAHLGCVGCFPIGISSKIS